MARPLRPSSELRERFDLYLTRQERAAIRGKALAARLPMSALVRRAALGLRCDPVPAITADQWSRLGPLAANLNQIARHLNAGATATCVDAGCIDELRYLLNDIRLALAGKTA